MFTQVTDQSIQRWETTEGEYAVAPDPSPDCPAGDMYSGHNCARRGGHEDIPEYDWWGDTSILNEPHEVATISYNGDIFTAVAADKDEAGFIAEMFAHWAEGNVFAVGFSPNNGDENIVYGVYTKDGLSPDLDEVKDILGHR